nr:hypothetical protein [Tanacetum cinerariifolium]
MRWIRGLRKKFLKREEDVKRKDADIANLKTRLENFEGDSLEFFRLHGCVFELKVMATARVEESASLGAKNVELIGQVSGLEALCDELNNQINGEDQLKKEFIAYKYEMDQRVTFKKKFLKREEDVKRKDADIANLKTRLENFEGDSLEFFRLHGCVFELKVMATARVEESASLGAKNVELIGQVSGLEALCDELNNQINGEDQLKKEFIAVQDSHTKSFEDHAM